MSLQDAYHDMVANLRYYCRGEKTKCSCDNGLTFDPEALGKTCGRCGGAAPYEDTCYACSNTGRNNDGRVTCTKCDGEGYTQAPCGGWILSDFDTFHHCPMHYNGQQHPEDDRP